MANRGGILLVVWQARTISVLSGEARGSSRSGDVYEVRRASSGDRNEA